MNQSSQGKVNIRKEEMIMNSMSKQQKLMRMKQSNQGKVNIRKEEILTKCITKSM